MAVIVSTHDAQSATTPRPHKINALCMKNSIVINKLRSPAHMEEIAERYSMLPSESKRTRGHALDKAN